MLRWILLIATTACSSAFAAEECYTADGSSGKVTFQVLQRGAPYTGSFRRFAGKACFAEGQLTRIDATLDPSSVDTGLPEIDSALMENDFFSVREFPQVTFTSTSIQTQNGVQLTRGVLEIKGTRRPIEVTLHTQQTGGKVSISGSFTLDRLQYGVGTGQWENTEWLSAEVKLGIDATMQLKR